MVGPSIKLAFSENRNSDDMVLYVGGDRDFAMQGNVPNEAVYNSKRLFDSEQKLAAAIEAVLKEEATQLAAEADWDEAKAADAKFEREHCVPGCGYTYWEMKNDISHS